jgi:hypothetical protein
MSGLSVVFQIPDAVRIGLETGALERVGGVVRDRATKHIVVWLRDGGMQQASSLLPNPIHAILHLAQAGVTVWDGNRTRQAIGVVSQQVAQLTQLTATGQMVNLAMSAMTFGRILHSVKALSDQIKTLEKAISQEFNRDRANRFYVALEAARDLFALPNAQQNEVTARSAIDGLLEARQNLLEDFKMVMAKPPERERLKLAEALLLQAIHAQISRIRCYWAMGHRDWAVQRLGEELPMFRQHVERVIRAYMQDEPVRYFERGIDAADLEQFFVVQQWLRGETGPLSATMMFAIVNDMRGSFWNAEVFGNIAQRTAQKVRGGWRQSLVEQLNACTLLIENYQRLEGFELEMRSVRLSLEEWEAGVDEALLNEHGGALIVESAWLEQMTE